ncbi:hypothetical protein HRbin20_00866 [bacterium HR20]|nr:hypothetical protein HRbin20_00866 [bacterium HR20]
MPEFLELQTEKGMLAVATFLNLQRLGLGYPENTSRHVDQSLDNYACHMNLILYLRAQG